MRRAHLPFALPRHTPRARAQRLAPALLLLVLAAGARAQTAEPELCGRLETLRGTTILHLHGSDREKGFAEGYLRAAALQELFDGWALSLLPRLAWERLVRPTLEARFDFADWAQARAEGLVAGMRAKGAAFVRSARLERELEPGDILAITALIDAPGLMCSSFAVHGDEVRGGGPIVTRHLDYAATAPMLRHTLLIVEAPEPAAAGTERNARHGTISIGWSSIGITTGISSAGVFVSIHDVPSPVRAKKGHTPRIQALQELLWTLTPGPKTAEDARGRLATHRFAYGGNALLAWRHDDDAGACVLEFGPAAENGPSVTLRGPEAGEDFVACTNHFRARRDAHGCGRYRRITAGLRDHPEDASLGRDELWRIAGTARVAATLHTVQCDLGAGRLRVDFRLRPEEDEWRTLALPLLRLWQVPAAAPEPQEAGR